VYNKRREARAEEGNRPRRYRGGYGKSEHDKAKSDLAS